MRALLAVFAYFLAGMAAIAEPQAVPLGPSPTLGGGGYSIGGGITVAAEPRRAADGTMAICGVWAQSERLSALVRREGRDVLATGNLAVDGRVVHRDLRRFNQVQAAESYTGAAAHCVGTGLRWREGARLDIRIPRQVVVNGRDGGDPGIEIRFGPSQRANPALAAGSLLPSTWTRF